MVKTILVDKTIADGRELLRAIDDAGIPVNAALWLYQPETDDWEFVIATPLVLTDGSSRVYARIQDIMDGLDGEIGSGRVPSRHSCVIIAPSSRRARSCVALA